MRRKSVNRIHIGLIASLFFFLSSPVRPQQKKPEVPYVPTPDNVVAEMFKIADVNKDDVLYDLGCGDGRIVVKAARELGCRGVGIDIDPIRIEESRENAVNAGVSDRVEFLLMDLFEADISQATVVTLYLLSKVNLRLRPKLFRELKPGTRVVSHEFNMDTWESDKSTTIDGDRYDNPYIYEDFLIDHYLDVHNVYLWIVPANVTGVWEWTMPAISGKKRFKLELDQKFQKVEGKAFEGSTPVLLHIKEGKIKGDRLEFTLERKRKGQIEIVQFEGVVKEHTMKGLVRIEGKPGVKEKWKAKRIPWTIRPIDE